MPNLYLLPLFLSTLFSYMSPSGLRPVPQTVPARASPPAASLYRTEFEAIEKAVLERFYDEDLHGLDWNRLSDAYRGRLGGVGGDRTFADLVNALLARLQASHTRLFTRDDFEYYLMPELFPAERPRRAGPPLRHIGTLMRADADHVVSAVLDGSVAAKAGLRPGDVLLAVDGVPYRGLTQYAAGKSVKLTYRRGSVKNMVRVTPVQESPLAALLASTRRSVKVLTLPGGGRIGYVHLWSTADYRFAAALETAVRRDLGATDGLILDLRDGFGGSPQGFADVFFRPAIQESQRGRGQRAAIELPAGYAKPIVVLTNAGTRSAKEMLAYTLQKSGRATLLGQKTAGAVLGAAGMPIGERFYLSLAVLDLRLDGQRLEGRGVSPDIVLETEASEAEWQRKALDALAAKIQVNATG